jgi:hypothetical protein
VEAVGTIARQAVVVVDLPARPEDRALGADVEAVRVDERGLIVIAEEGDPAVLADELHALAGIGTVADDVTEAEHLVDALPIDVAENGLECLEVAVDVTDDGAFHADRFRWFRAPVDRSS